MGPSIDVVHTRMIEEREAAGLTLDDMAERLGLSKSYVREMEKQNDPGPWRHIVNWAKETGTTTDYLLDAPWARNRERAPGTDYTAEALEAMRIIDALPLVARQFILNAVGEYAQLFGALVASQTHAARLLLLLAELNVEAQSAETININPATIDEALQELLGRLRE